MNTISLFLRFFELLFPLYPAAMIYHFTLHFMLNVKLSQLFTK